MLGQYIDHMSPGAGLSLIVLALALIVAVRYAVFAGGALLLIRLFERRLAPRRLQPVPFCRAQLIREAGYSALSFLVFGAVAGAAYLINQHVAIYRIYTDIESAGWAWFFLSIPAAILVHDFYFYWAHRFMHLPGVYDRVHRVHHLSTNPSPLSAFAFHPLEAVIEALGFVFILVVVPLHPIAFLAVSTFMIAYNVMGHLGYELLPRGLPDRPVLGLMNTATSHNQHHRTYRYNYGLYTLIWDHVFGTLHPQYAKTFDAAASQPPATT